MAILYDWQKIVRLTKGRARHIVLVLDMITNGTKPKSNQDIRLLYQGRDFKGNSFLLNPEQLLQYRHCYSDKEIAEYLALASYRSYPEYIITGDASLSMIKSPVTMNKLNSNRLLTVKSNRIYFLYEEVIKEK